MQKEGSVLSVLHGSTAGGALAKLAVMVVALVAMVATSLALSVGSAAAEEEYVPEDIDTFEIGDDAVMGASLGDVFNSDLVGIVFEYNAALDDTQPASARNAVKYVVDVLDQAGNEIPLPAGSLVPAKIDLDQKSTVNVALSYISIPGATYEATYFWWGGTYVGSKTAVSTFSNFMVKSLTRGYDSYLGFTSPDGQGSDYTLFPGWYAYNPTGTLHIVYRMNVVPELSVTNYYGSYDGLAHTGTVSASAGATVEYSADGQTWTADVPTITDAGTATYQVRAVYGGVYSETQTLTLQVVPRNAIVRIQGNYVTAAYDGQPHAVDGYTVAGIVVEEFEGVPTPAYTEDDFAFTGAQSPSAYRADAGTTYMGLTLNDFINQNGNFAVTFEVGDGYVAIAPRAVTIGIAGSSVTTTYDGTEQSAIGWAITSVEVAEVVGQPMPEFDESTVKFGSVIAIAKGTNAGFYPMGISAEEFWCDDENFAATIEYTDGALTIEPRAVSVQVAGNSAITTYDGTEQTLVGWEVTSFEVAEVEDLPTPAFDDSSIKFGSVVAIAKGTDAGDYPMGLSAEEFWCDDDNFEATIEYTDGVLTIEPRNASVRIEGNVVTATYNGKEQTAEGWVATDVQVEEVEGQPTPDDFDAASVKSQSHRVAKGTDAGTYQMGLSADEFFYEGKNYNVTFTVDDGSLVISALDGVVVTIKGNAATYNYDGKPHTVEGYTASFSSPLFTDKDFYMTGTASVTATKVGTYAMGLKADQFSVASKNFSNVKFVVTDGQLAITGESIPKTGDDTNAALPVAAGVVGACAVAAAAVMISRRQREN